MSKEKGVRMNIPLSKAYVDEEIKKRVLEVIDSGQYIRALEKIKK